MKTLKTLTIIVCFFSIQLHFSQVGIGNTDPKATLDISVPDPDNPLNTDGVLVPRVNTLTFTGLSSDQNGMIVYLNTDVTISTVLYTEGFYYWNNSAGNWSLVGGAKKINDLIDGKSDDASYIGSSIFLGLYAGSNDDETDNQNVGIGYQALLRNRSGYENVAVGYQTLTFNTTGYENIANGHRALRGNTTGYRNVATGISALSNNTSGHHNVAIGSSVLTFNTGGDYNIALGNSALLYNSIGNHNIATGYEVLTTNTEGEYNIANGYQALNQNTEGDHNIATGYRALHANSTGIENLANGHFALYLNDTGNYNIAAGFGALRSNTEGDYNIATGYHALYNNTEGDSNLAIGRRALYSNTTGRSNIAIGSSSGSGSIGDSNMFLGNSAGSGETGSNKLYIENTSADQDNALIYGEFDTNILRINGELQIGNPSGMGYSFSTSDGTANQVMTTDGAGLLTFNTLIEENTTASNGLTETVNDIRLGGSLTQDTNIDYGNFDTRFNLDGSGDFIIQDTGSGVFLIDDAGETTVSRSMVWKEGNIIGTTLADLTDDNDDGLFRIYDNGIASILLDANGTSVFNEQGFDRNFRIETNNSNDMFFIDGGTNRIGIGTTTPDYRLSVDGQINLREDAGTGTALSVEGNQAIYYNTATQLFSWGFGGLINYFADDVGIGTTTPSYKLDINDSDTGDFIAQIYNTDTSGNADGLKIRIGNTGVIDAFNSLIGFFDGNNAVVGVIRGGGGGVFYSTTSDKRLKTNINDIDNALNLIDKIQPRQYEFKVNLGTQEYGFIAQELQPLYPQAVSGSPDSDVEKNPMMVDYGRLTPLLTAGIKELKNEVDDLKEENQKLKEELSKYELLEARLTALENTSNVSSEEILVFSKED